ITVLFRPSIQSRVTGTRELNTFEKCHRSQGSLNTLKCQVFIRAKINFFFKLRRFRVLTAVQPCLLRVH
ncbi:hypothetical protein B0H12DRAFT_1122914, partial [Mycena haematopus]